MKTVFQLQNRYNVSASDLAEQVIVALHSAGYSVTTAFLKGRQEAGQPASRANATFLLSHSSRDIKGLRFGLAARLRQWLVEHPHSVFIAHRFKPISLMLMLNLLKRFDLCIGVVHGFGDYDRRYRRWLVRLLVRPNCRFVAVSEPVRGYLLGLHCGFTEQNTTVINNAIDIEQVRGGQLPRSEARRTLGIPDDNRVVIGTIGRLVPVKDHRTLIEAAARLRQQQLPIRVVIIGGGRLYDELKTQIDQHALHDTVILAGEREQAVQYLQAFDIFTLTSLSEGLPLALLEGMSAALPVVGSDIPSIRWIVESIGRTYPVGNAEKLADTLATLVQMSPVERAALGERHLDYVRAHHAIEDFRQHYLDLVQQRPG